MKTSVYAICVLGFLSTSFSLGQTNRVLVSIDWPTKSYENKVEVYDPANNLLATICNDTECYSTSGTFETYAGTYDFGCLTIDPIALPNYYIKIYNANNNAWSSGSSVTVNVAGVDVLTDNGASASTSGHQIDFNVNSTTYCNFPDTDGDLVIDFVDLDDDNDGILDVDEALGLDTFNCHVPALNFKDNVLESGTDGQVGAIYRFPNAIFGEPYDVLVEITEMHDATLSTIDDDTVDNADYLQSRITFTGNDNPTTGVDYPGITFKFTIVNEGTSDPSASLFRIGGTTWDVDGATERRESVRYYNPSAYGLDNPSTLEVTDALGDGSQIEMTAGGNLEGPGFSTYKELRAYFQFLSNTFTLRMHNLCTTYTGSNTT